MVLKLVTKFSLTLKRISPIDVTLLTVSVSGAVCINSKLKKPEPTLFIVFSNSISVPVKDA